MDNASKALIMAGAILIAVAIVGIGIYIFSASNSLTNNAVGQIDTIAVQMFNNTFTQYAVGVQQGQKVPGKADEIINGTRAQQLYNVAKATDGVQVTGVTTFTSTAAYVVTYTTDMNTGYITVVNIAAK